MNAIKKFFFVVTLAVLGANSAANACSYVIDEVGVKNHLAATALTHLKLNIDQVSQTQTSDFRWWESKPTRMCPDEVTYEATFKFGYELSPLLGCSTTVKVTKIDSWATDVDDEFRFETIRPQMCE